MSASPHIDFFFSPFLCIVTFYVLTPFSSRKFVHLFPFFHKKRRNALKREQGVTCLCDVANFHILFCYTDMHAHMRANNKFQLPLYGTKVNEEECVGIVCDQACPGVGRRRKLCFFCFFPYDFTLYNCKSFSYTEGNEKLLYSFKVGCANTHVSFF